MKGFLKFAGVVEILLYIAGIFVLAFTIKFVGINIFYFALYCAMGPTFGIICFAIAQIIENTEYTIDRLEEIEKSVKNLKEEQKVENKQPEPPVD